jgi:N-acetylneuraminic acid mutarotase
LGRDHSRPEAHDANRRSLQPDNRSMDANQIIQVAPGVWGSRGVWTGTEMLVWGGSHRNGDDEINQVLREGAAYDPVKNSWRPMSIDGAPSSRFFHDAVWTGRQMIIWGGGEYDPLADRWTPLAWKRRPAGRGMHSAVWTGQGMMIFGGSTGGSSAFSDSTAYRSK